MRTALLVALLVGTARADGLEAATTQAIRTGKPMMVVFRCVP
ncbi:MAG: hypothetical protein ACYS0E_01840 [Planctomycetota bacterium]|jgi:hypothetical protein